MKKADTKKAKEQTQNAPVGTRAGKKNGEGSRIDKLAQPRMRRAAFGDLTNEQPQETAGGKKQDDLKKTKPAAPALKMKVNAARKKTTTATAGKKKTSTKSAPPAPSTERSEPEGAEVSDCVPDLKCTETFDQVDEMVESVVTENPDLFLSSQESTTSSSEVASASSGSADVSMTEAEGSKDGLDDSRMSTDQSILESSMMNAEEMPHVPIEDGVEDVDSENKNDICHASLYAHDIFTYYKERESKFLLTPYMIQQPHLQPSMRAILVDWLVEVQENFELNHETLYLAVKLTDTYLACSPGLLRDQLQLVGAAALFVACKFDERVPPAVEDFLYLCDDAYRKPEFLAMERNLLRAVGFDLGRPISYRFLRRYAKCGRSPVVTLTLARYILELSLMEYKFISYRDSLMAASALYIARCMQREPGWTKTLEFYTGYKLDDIRPVVLELNPILTANHYNHLTTIRAKYNHVVFHSVGKIPTLSNAELFASPPPAPKPLILSCHQEAQLDDE